MVEWGTEVIVLPHCPTPKNCPCTSRSCPNRGYCCDCVKKHRETDSLPYCLFPDNDGDHHVIFYYQKLKKRFEGESGQAKDDTTE